MRLFALNLAIAIIWVAVWGNASFANLLLGFAVGFVALWVVKPLFGEPTYFQRFVGVLRLIGYFLYDLFMSSIRVIHDVLTPEIHSKPGIIAVPLDAETDAEILLTANLISLTPGTLSLDVSSDRKILYVHAMFLEDVEEMRRGLKDGMEAKILEAMR